MNLRSNVAKLHQSSGATSRNLGSRGMASVAVGEGPPLAEPPGAVRLGIALGAWLAARATA